MCFNKKVLAGLGAVGVGIFVLASPSAAVRALPFLLMAACPLSMLVMGGMGAAMKPKAEAPPNPLQPMGRDAEITALCAKLEALVRRKSKAT